MINFSQPGESIEYTNSGSAISSGDPVVIGNRVGFAVADIAATTGVGTVKLGGVYLADKDGDEAFTQGDALFYDSSDSTFTKTATGNKWAGYAFADAIEASTSCYIKLEAKPKQSTVIAALGATSALVGVDGVGSNAAPLVATEARLDAIEAKVDALIAALKASGQMANS